MNTYRVRLQARSALQLGDEPLEATYADARVVMRDWNDETVSPAAHQGLTFDVFVASGSMLAALDMSSDAAQVLVDQLAAIHAAAIADPEAVLVFHLGESQDMQMGQVISDVPTRTLPRQFRPDTVTAAMSQILSERHRPHLWRISRAMHHLRRETLEQDPLDRFEDLWDGLELLNGLIKERFSLETGYAGSRCSQCGHIPTVTGGSQGVRYAVITLAGETREVWNELRRVRQEIVHGAGNVAHAADRLSELSAVLRKALTAALC